MHSKESVLNLVSPHGTLSSLEKPKLRIGGMLETVAQRRFLKAVVMYEEGVEYQTCLANDHTRTAEQRTKSRDYAERYVEWLEWGYKNYVAAQLATTIPLYVEG